MHIHAVPPRLPGVRPLTALYDGPLEALVKALREEMRQSGTRTLLGMGHLGGEGDDRLGAASTWRIAELLPAMHAIGVANPTQTDTDHLQRVDAQLRTGKIVALK